MDKGRAAVLLGAEELFDIREYEIRIPEPGAIVVRVTPDLIRNQ